MFSFDAPMAVLALVIALCGLVPAAMALAAERRDRRAAEALAAAEAVLRRGAIWREKAGLGWAAMVTPRRGW